MIYNLMINKMDVIVIVILISSLQILNIIIVCCLCDKINELDKNLYTQFKFLNRFLWGKNIEKEWTHEHFYSDLDKKKNEAE